MRRVELARLLSRDGEVFELCREALLAGARFEIWPGLVERKALARIYSLRAALARKRNVPAMGMDEAAEALGRFEGPEVALGYVDDGPAGYHFQLFLAPDLSGVVACLGAGLKHDPQPKA
ncbi:hypothetical protein [Catelliglobosispora koreensis]|uniref:hypothetical protein n=1 Tax=Catelliglobosispora koreensis TaxID=129052 RepID=UPI000360B401|nr:hypothetical protein [Catelliglobosispora koreensis]